jgi:hypothetical protein
MTTTLILAGIIFTAILGVAVAAPLLSQSMQTSNRSRSQPSLTTRELEEKLNLLIVSVRDLDFDYDTGKITEEDYIQQRKVLVGRGVSALIQVDAARQRDDVLEHQIETMISDYRHQAAP